MSAQRKEKQSRNAEATPGGDSTDAPRRGPPWWLVVVLLTVMSLLLMTLGFRIDSTELWVVEMLVGCAALSGGGFLGFLFGIPRSVTGDGIEAVEGTATARDGQTAKADPSQRVGSVPYRPSTNLEQVSDWLTKILVGVGLVELHKLGGVLALAGSRVGGGFPGISETVAVITQLVIITFAISGFLCGFLWTRVYYGPIQTLADNDLIARLFPVVSQRLDAQETKISLQAAEAEEAKKMASLLVQGGLSMPEGRVPAARAKADGDRIPGSYDEQQWPAEIREKVDAFRREEVDWDSDPTADYFGQAPAEANGRRLEARIVAHLGDALVLSLRVVQTDGHPLDGPVAFVLHPSFPERVLKVNPKAGSAEASIYAEEWFTVAAVADAGRTVLSYDLRRVKDAPTWFTRS